MRRWPMAGNRHTFLSQILRPFLSLITKEKTVQIGEVGCLRIKTWWNLHENQLQNIWFAPI